MRELGLDCHTKMFELFLPNYTVHMNSIRSCSLRISPINYTLITALETVHTAVSVWHQLTGKSVVVYLMIMVTDDGIFIYLILLPREKQKIPAIPSVTMTI